MRYLLVLLLSAVVVCGQPILRNEATTNADPYVKQLWSSIRLIDSFGHHTNHFGFDLPTSRWALDGDLGLTNMIAFGTYYGNGAGLTNIPLSGLAQSGASGGQVAQWNGSAWVPTSPTNGTAIPITVTSTNFILNTVYTNGSGTVQGLDVTVALHGAAVSGSSAMDLWADQSGGNNFVLQDRVAVSTLLTSIVTDYTNSLSGFVTNRATYYFTNSSVGAGNTSSIVPGTGEVVTFGNIFAAGNVALTTVENTYTTDQHFNGKVTINQLVLTNGFFSGTNTWTGASNVVDVSIYRQSYQTVTPFQFSGFINSSNSLAAECQVSIYNNSSSNVTGTYGQGVTDRDFNTQVTLTNGNKGIFWIQVDPSLKKGTNIVFNQF